MNQLLKLNHDKTQTKRRFPTLFWFPSNVSHLTYNLIGRIPIVGELLKHRIVEAEARIAFLSQEEVDEFL